MPFQKISPGKYQSPSGRTYDLAQVRLWYANGGKFPGQKSDSNSLLDAYKNLASGPKWKR